MDKTPYKEAKKIIKKVGYSNLSGASEELALAEVLEMVLSHNCMTIKAKKIYDWGQNFEIKLHPILLWIKKDKENNNIWLFWSAILDKKPLNIK